MPKRKESGYRYSHVCVECGKGFKSLKEAERHQIEKHTAENPRMPVSYYTGDDKDSALVITREYKRRLPTKKARKIKEIVYKRLKKKDARVVALKHESYEKPAEKFEEQHGGGPVRKVKKNPEAYTVLTNPHHDMQYQHYNPSTMRYQLRDNTYYNPSIEGMSYNDANFWQKNIRDRHGFAVQRNPAFHIKMPLIIGVVSLAVLHFMARR